MTHEELRNLIAEAVSADPSELKEDSSAATIEGWDSMASLCIISVLDDALDGEITAEDARSFGTFGGIVVFARAKGILTD